MRAISVGVICAVAVGCSDATKRSTGDDWTPKHRASHSEAASSEPTTDPPASTSSAAAPSATPTASASAPKPKLQLGPISAATPGAPTTGGGLGMSGVGAGSGDTVAVVANASGAEETNGRLSPQVIQHVLRTRYSALRSCFESGLVVDPNASGAVSTTFVIGTDGAVESAQSKSNALPAITMACLERAFSGLVFPAPTGGRTKVTYPVEFATDRPTVLKIYGKTTSYITESELRMAFERAGCSNVVRVTEGAAEAPVVFSLERAGRTLTITFNPASALSVADAVLGGLKTQSVGHFDGAFVLAVTSADGDKLAALDVLAALFDPR